MNTPRLLHFSLIDTRQQQSRESGGLTHRVGPADLHTWAGWAQCGCHSRRERYANSTRRQHHYQPDGDADPGCPIANSVGVQPGSLPLARHDQSGRGAPRGSPDPTGSLPC
jgi:hypothetical protein